MTRLSKMCCRVNKIWEWKNHQGQLGYFSRDHLLQALEKKIQKKYLDHLWNENKAMVMQGLWRSNECIDLEKRGAMANRGQF